MCKNKQTVGCYMCNLTACSELVRFKCLDCMEVHQRCAILSGVDYRPYIDYLKRGVTIYCITCENKYKYRDLHYCGYYFTRGTKDCQEVLDNLKVRDKNE